MSTAQTPSANRFRFRAWHRPVPIDPSDIEDWEKPKMYYDVQELYDGGVEGLGHVSSFGALLDDPEYVVMQSTGLLDKNGKEIFEGDIITAWSQGYQHTGEVRWRAGADGGGCPCYIIYPAYADGHFWHLNGGKDQSDVEIIGNIYEHPDLLKP